MPSSLWISPTTIPSGCAASSERKIRKAQARLRERRTYPHNERSGRCRRIARTLCFHTSTIVERWNLSRLQARFSGCFRPTGSTVMLGTNTYFCEVT